MAAWRGRVGLVESGLGKANLLKTGAEWRQNVNLRQASESRQKALGLRKEADQAEKTGDYAKSIEKREEASQLDKKAGRDEKWAKSWGRGATAAKYAGRAVGVGFIAEAAEDAGKKDQAAAKDFRYKEAMREKDTMKPKSNDEVDDLASGRKTGASKAQQTGAILEALERKTAGAAAGVDKFRETLQKLGADEKTVSTFERSVERNFPEKAKLSDEEKNRRMDAGQYNFKEAPGEQIKALAQAIAQSKAKEGYEKDINADPGKRDAYVEGLVAAQTRVIDQLKTATGAQRETLESGLRDINSAVLRSAEKSQALVQSFSMKGGNFEGANAGVNETAFRDAMKQKNADELMLKMPAGEIEGAVADAMMKGLSKNSLTEAAKGAKTKDQEASVDKLVSKIRSTGGSDPDTKALYDLVQTSPVFNHDQPRPPRVRPPGPAGGGGAAPTGGRGGGTPPPVPPAAPPTPPPAPPPVPAGGAAP